MKTLRIIFDLDGTLIDSSHSILVAFKGAFNVLGKNPVRPITSDIVGPPLKEALVLLSGTNDPILLSDLEAAFMERYDTEGYRQTVVFPGVSEMLKEFISHGVSLFVATNKRDKPTHLIFEHLDWAHFFSGVYALDSINPPASCKAELLKHILRTHSINPNSTVYVGDRKDDEIAAGIARTNFVYAAWGYGNGLESTDCLVCRSLKDFCSLFIRNGKFSLHQMYIDTNAR